MEGAIVLFWLGFSIVVGVAANARGRSGLGWFLLSLIISPLIALLLVLVMERQNAAVAAAPPATFEPDSVHAGIPYRLQSDGSVEAIMQGARVRFSDQDKFAVAAGLPLPERLPPPQATQAPRQAPNLDKRPWAWVFFGGAILLMLAVASRQHVPPGSPREEINTRTGARVLAAAKAIEDANAAYNRGDYPAAIKMYRDMAADGNPKAQLSVGLMYLGGQGVARDLVIAQEWFKSAAANPASNQATRAEAISALDVVTKRLAR